MKKRILGYILILLFVLTLFITGCDNRQPAIEQANAVSKTQTAKSTAENKQNPTQTLPAEQQGITGLLKVHFIDVGQADSILLQMPASQVVLIDGGNNDDGKNVVEYLKSQGVKKLDAVIATHMHEDHIGGLDTIINTFPPASVYMPNSVTTTKTFTDFITAVKASGAKRIQAKANVKLDIPGINGVFLAPAKDKYDDLNNYSAVLKLTFGNTSFLFAGDAEAESEGEMLLSSVNSPKADLLKVGHHGSASSSTEEFLKAVAPKYAVISVGKDNDYGHPAKSTLDRLAKLGIQVFRTDEAGTITATSDGNSIILDKSASPIKPNAPPSGSSAYSSTINNTNKTVSPSQEKQTTTVYITRTGKKYHRDGCRYLARSKIPISLSNAKALGYTPCSVCRPPD